MKKWKDIMRSKGIYIVSLFGTITILAVAAIAMNLMEGSTKDGTNIDLNETPGIVLEEKENTQLVKQPINEEIQRQENGIERNNVQSVQADRQLQEIKESDLLVNHITSEAGMHLQENVSKKVAFLDGQTNEQGSLVTTEQTMQTDLLEGMIIGQTDSFATTEQNTQTDLLETTMTEEIDFFGETAEYKQAEETQVVSGMNPESLIHNLSFVPEQGMVWPMQGAVVLNYSMEHAVYHVTLDSYRTSDGILIRGEEGMPVRAAVKGVVTDVTEDLKTGTTVTMRISEDYSIRYGQLAEVTVKVGTMVEQGEQFAVVGKPSKYYTKEGSCLYIQVLKGETPVNPMLYLQDEE